MGHLKIRGHLIFKGAMNMSDKDSRLGREL